MIFRVCYIHLRAGDKIAGHMLKEISHLDCKKIRERTFLDSSVAMWKDLRVRLTTKEPLSYGDNLGVHIEIITRSIDFYFFIFILRGSLHKRRLRRIHLSVFRVTLGARKISGAFEKRAPAMFRKSCKKAGSRSFIISKDNAQTFSCIVIIFGFELQIVHIMQIFSYHLRQAVNPRRKERY